MKVRPYHILVHFEYEAKDILRLLEGGKSFEELAKTYSLCPSGQMGGFLGEVDSQRLDSVFLEVFESLGSGAVSKPTRTRFGWHLIKKES